MGKAKAGNGSGTVTERGPNQWRWQLTIPAGPGETSKRLSGTCTNKTAAVRALAHARSDLDRGVLAAPDDVTVSEYAARWLKLQGNLRESSLKNYEAELGYALETPLGAMRLQAVRLPHLKTSLAAVAARQAMKNGVGGSLISPRTVRKVVTRLRAVFKEAVRDGIIYANPAEALQVKTPTAKEVARALTVQEAVTFVRVGQALEAAGQASLWPALYTALAAGLRRGEVLGLRWEDLDFKRGQIHVRQSVSDAVKGGGIIVGPLKTTASRRDVHLPASLAESLLRHRARQAETSERAGRAWRSSGLVFPTATGAACHPDNMNRALHWVLRWCQPGGVDESRFKGVPVTGRTRLRAALAGVGEGVPVIRVHDLRHTYATHALRNGVPVAVVSRLLGHRKIMTTLDVYRHVLEDEMDAGAVDLFALPEDQPGAATVSATA